MYKGHRVLVVIPCYNVERHVRAVVSAMPAHVDDIIAVDDGSTDGTLAQLEDLAGSRLTIMRHDTNRGLGAAMITGIEEAVARDADIVIKLDGDGQMDPARIDDLLEPIVLDGYDYAKGNRLLDHRELARMPRARLFGNFALTFFTKLASGYWTVLDPQNGFVAIRARTWQLLDPARISRGYFFENDMLVNLNIVGARVKDVRIPARYSDERSQLRIGRIVPSFLRLLIGRTLYRFYMKYVLLDFSPIALFVLLGLPLLLWGVGFGAWAWWWHVQREVLASTGTVMLSVLPLILGFNLLLQALVLDIQSTPR